LGQIWRPIANQCFGKGDVPFAHATPLRVTTVPHQML
jgi:hypothetical protein